MPGCWGRAGQLLPAPAHQSATCSVGADPAPGPAPAAGAEPGRTSRDPRRSAQRPVRRHGVPDRHRTSSAIAVSVRASTSARCPRSRRASPRARAVLPAHPPRSGSWPAPPPVAVSPAQGGRSAQLRVAPLTSARNGQPSQCAGVAGPPPLHDVAGVQALPTLFVISGKLSIPALGSLIVSGQVPQPRLAERAEARAP